MKCEYGYGDAAGERHLANVRKVGCVICNRHAQAHHPIGNAWRKNGHRKASDFDAIALCFDHHQAQTKLPFGYAVHKGTQSFEKRFGTQAHLLERTRTRLRSMGFPDGTEHARS